MNKNKVIQLGIILFIIVSVVSIVIAFSKNDKKVDVGITEKDFTSTLSYHVYNGNDIDESFKDKKVYLLVSDVKYVGTNEVNIESIEVSIDKLSLSGETVDVTKVNQKFSKDYFESKVEIQNNKQYNYFMLTVSKELDLPLPKTLKIKIGENEITTDIEMYREI